MWVMPVERTKTWAEDLAEHSSVASSVDSDHSVVRTVVVVSSYDYYCHLCRDLGDGARSYWLSLWWTWLGNWRDRSRWMVVVTWLMSRSWNLLPLLLLLLMSLSLVRTCVADRCSGLVVAVVLACSLSSCCSYSLSYYICLQLGCGLLVVVLECACVLFVV